MRGDGVRAFAADEDTHIGDAHLLHQVELLLQAFAVASLALAGQDSTIPEVCADEFVLGIAAIELAIASRHECLADDGLLALTGKETCQADRTK